MSAGGRSPLQSTINLRGFTIFFIFTWVYNWLIHILIFLWLLKRHFSGLSDVCWWCPLPWSVDYFNNIKQNFWRHQFKLSSLETLNDFHNIDDCYRSLTEDIDHDRLKHPDHAEPFRPRDKQDKHFWWHWMMNLKEGTNRFMGADPLFKENLNFITQCKSRVYIRKFYCIKMKTV